MDGERCPNGPLNRDVRIGEFLIAFETRDEIFVVGMLLEHVLFEIGFARENCWTVCTMKLLGVALMR